MNVLMKLLTIGFVSKPTYLPCLTAQSELLRHMFQKSIWAVSMFVLNISMGGILISHMK